MREAYLVIRIQWSFIRIQWSFFLFRADFGEMFRVRFWGGLRDCGMFPFNMTSDHPCCLALKWAEITLEFCENRVGACKCPVIFQRHLRIGRKITHFAKQLPTIGLLGTWSHSEWEFLGISWQILQLCNFDNDRRCELRIFFFWKKS